jgi:hypothetical protein
MDINSVGPRSQVYVPSPNPNGHHLPKVNQEQMRAVLALGVKGGAPISNSCRLCRSQPWAGGRCAFDCETRIWPKVAWGSWDDQPCFPDNFSALIWPPLPSQLIPASRLDLGFIIHLEEKSSSTRGTNWALEKGSLSWVPLSTCLRKQLIWRMTKNT